MKEMKIRELIEKGKELAARKDHAEACRLFRQAFDADPGNEAALFELGKTCYVMRDYASAETVLVELRARHPGNREAALLLGKTYKESGRHGRAVEIFRDLAKAGPAGRETYRELGELYRNGGDYALAAEMFENCRGSGPADETLMLELAGLYNFTGDYDRAAGTAREMIERGGMDLFFENCFLNELETARRETVLKSKPRILLVTLTARCNLKCPMCGRASVPWDIPDARRDEIRGMLPYLELVTWQGGEVFLYPHFRTLFAEAKKNRRLKQIIITNGLLIDDRWADELASAGTVDLTISIDSTRPGTYEQLRVGGTLKTLIGSIEKIRRAKEKHGSNMTLTLRCAIMEQNYRELDDFLEFAKAHGFNVVLMAPISGDRDPANIFIRKDRQALSYVSGARGRLEEKAAAYGIRLLNWLPRFDDEKAEAREERAPAAKHAAPVRVTREMPVCFRPWRQIAVNVAGEIYPECLCGKPAGTVFADSFTSVWNNETMREYREKLARLDRRLCGEPCRTGSIPPEHLKFIYG